MSQASRIVALLRERPHTTAEILREVPCIVHSRINDLRGAGYAIVCDQVGLGADGFVYTLLSEPGRADRLGPDGAAGSLSGVDEHVVTSSAEGIGEGSGCEAAFPVMSVAPGPDSCAAQLSLLDEAA